MFNLFNSASDWLFLALGWGFALITIVMSWWAVDHGLIEVVRARQDRDDQQDELTALEQRESALRAEYPQTYVRIRQRGLETIAQSKALMEVYRERVIASARYRDIDMVVPETELPTELQSPEPPPMPPLVRKRDDIWPGGPWQPSSSNLKENRSDDRESKP